MEYLQFGTCLLDDSGENLVQGIETFRQSHPDTTISDILQEWLKGKVRRPVTWSTLLACLRNTHLHALADNLENVMNGTLEAPNYQGNPLCSIIVT